MADVNSRVGSDNDDAFRRLVSDYYVRTAATYEEAGRWSSTNKQSGSGMRFNNITIPNAATINTATITGRAERTTTRDGSHVCNTRLWGEAADNPATMPADSATFDTRRANKTTAIVDWDGIPGWTVNSDYTSPSLVTIIQELVNRAGWASGNSIVIYWNDWDDRSTGEGSGTLMGLAHWLDYYSSSTNCPILDITYTSGWAGISKFIGVGQANISKVSSVAKASIAKITGKAV